MKNEVGTSRIRSFEFDGPDMSPMKIHGLIGTRSKTWTNIVRSIRIFNWAEDDSRIHWKRLISRKRILFSQVLQEFGYTLRKLGFGHEIVCKPLKGVKNLFLVF